MPSFDPDTTMLNVTLYVSSDEMIASLTCELGYHFSDDRETSTLEISCNETSRAWEPAVVTCIEDGKNDTFRYQKL